MNFLQLSQTVNLPRFPVHLSPVLMLEKFYTWEDKRYQQNFTKGEGEKFSYYCDLCTIFLSPLFMSKIVRLFMYVTLSNIASIVFKNNEIYCLKILNAKLIIVLYFISHYLWVPMTIIIKDNYR